jgi:hypothetical protein
MLAAAQAADPGSRLQKLAIEVLSRANAGTLTRAPKAHLEGRRPRSKIRVRRRKSPTAPGFWVRPTRATPARLTCEGSLAMSALGGEADSIYST